MPRKSDQKLTKRYIDSQALPKEGARMIWDAGLSGFGLRISSTGTRSFLVKYRTRKGEQRKLTLGQYGPLTLEQARALARAALGKVASGEDPASDRKRDRNAQTVGKLCDFYIAEARAGRVFHRGRVKKTNTLDIDQGRIDRHIKPLLGRIKIDELEAHQVQTFLHDVADGKTIVDVRTGPRGRARVSGGMGTAKKAVSLLSSVYNFGIKRGLVKDNPCRLVERPADQKRDRYLNPTEYARLGQVLSAQIEMNKSLGANLVIRGLALTGCRTGELLALRRSDLDAEGRCLRLAQTKTGPQIRPIGATAIEHLSDVLAVHESEWVFPSTRNDGHITDIRKPMLVLTDAAKLMDVTPHILRHSYDTVAHELGYSELTIAGLLGHKLHSVTSRYAHHVDHVLADAADRVSALIDERLVAETP